MKPPQMYLHQCWALLQHLLIFLVHHHHRVMGYRGEHSGRACHPLSRLQCKGHLLWVIWLVSREAQTQALTIHRWRSHRAICQVDYIRLAIKAWEIIQPEIPIQVLLSILRALRACLPCQGGVQEIWVWTWVLVRKMQESLLKRVFLMSSETGSASFCDEGKGNANIFLLRR